MTVSCRSLLVAAAAMAGSNPEFLRRRLFEDEVDFVEVDT